MFFSQTAGCFLNRYFGRTGSGNNESPEGRNKVTCGCDLFGKFLKS